MVIQFPKQDSEAGGFCAKCHNHSTLKWDQRETAWMSHCCGEISEPYGDYVGVDYYEGGKK